MSQTSGFFNSQLIEGQPDRAYSASDFASYFASFIGNGVFAHNLDELEVAPASNNLSVKVKPGRAYANGYWYLSSENEALFLDGNATSQSRWDAVVLGFNYTQRTAELSIKKGTTAVSYQNGKQYIYDNLSRTSELFELCLAIVEVPKNVVTYQVSEANIYDVRAEEYCGWVTGLVEQMDVSSIFKQMQAQFTLWFNEMKDQLSEDAAGNLQLEIDALNNAVSGSLPTEIYSYDPENDDQENSTQYMELSRGALEFNELEIQYQAYYQAQDNTGVLQVAKVKVPETLQKLREVGIGLQFVNTSGTTVKSIHYSRYLFDSDDDTKLRAISGSTTTTLYPYGSDIVNTHIQTVSQHNLRIVKIFGIGDRSAAPVICGYFEVQTDTVTDNVTEVTQGGE